MECTSHLPVLRVGCQEWYLHQLWGRLMLVEKTMRTEHRIVAFWDADNTKDKYFILDAKL